MKANLVTRARAGGEPLRYALGVAGILVIEDDPINQMILVDYLAANGYQMHVAATAAEGLAMCAQVDPALVLLDVQLPGKNGFDVRQRDQAAQFRARGAHDECSVFAARSTRAERPAGGLADGYLAKPFDLKALLLDVERLIGSSKTGCV